MQLVIGSLELTANPRIKQDCQVCETFEKNNMLFRLIDEALNSGPGAKVLLFCRTKKSTDFLVKELRTNGFNAFGTHGDKSQSERSHVLEEFRSARAPLLVATDVASRGIDVDNIRLVINYEMPTNIEDYIHRIGRTCRAGAEGYAYSFVHPDYDVNIAPNLLDVMRQAKQNVPQDLIDLAAQAGRGKSHYSSRNNRSNNHSSSSSSSRGYKRSNPTITGTNHVPIGKRRRFDNPSGSNRFISNNSDNQSSSSSSSFNSSSNGYYNRDNQSSNYNSSSNGNYNRDNQSSNRYSRDNDRNQGYDRNR